MSTQPFTCATAAVLATVGLCGCGGVQKQTPFMKASPEVVSTAQELRFRTFALTDELTDAIETGADRIITEADDPQVRRHALLWQANGIPAVHEASFQTDPLASMIDVWALTVQMADFFEQGAGRDLFGPWQPIAIETSRDMLRRCRDVAAASATAQGVQNGEEIVTRWAEAHPIENLLFVRSTAVEAWAEALAQGGQSGLGAVSDINEQVAELMNRITVYMSLIPRETRWQAELLLEQVREDSATQAFLGDVASVDQSVQEIETYIADIRRIFVGIDALITEQRLAAMREVHAELMAVLDRITEERKAVMAGIEQERTAVMDAIDAERVAVMEETDALSQARLQEAMDGARAMIDHFFLRLVQLLLAILVLAIVGWVILVRRAQRST